MARVQFKAKVREVFGVGGEPRPYHYVAIPRFGRQHCAMNAMRRHPKLGGFANSDLFPNLLNWECRKVLGASEDLYLEEIPEGVTVATSGFLAVVSFEL